MKVYIAAPFASKSINKHEKAYGIIVDKEYINFLEEIESCLRKCGFDPILPHKQNNWGEVYIEPEEMARIDFNLIRACDIVVALPQKSRGVHVELGYAAALGKSIIVIFTENETLSTMIQGLVSVTNTKFFRFHNQQEIIQKLEYTFRKWIQC